MSALHRHSGLTHAEAARRLTQHGANELPQRRARGFFNLIGKVLLEPMLLLLIAAATIYLIFGNLREAIVLTISLLVVVVITVLQERRTEHALTRLKELTSPRALVIREGVEKRIPGSEVVVGDIVLLREGDRVAADGLLHSATALSIDESLLTGESLPVEKRVDAPFNHDNAKVYSGTLIVYGYGVAQVTATGANTEIGKIGGALTNLSLEITPLFREVRQMVRWVAVGGLLLCATIAMSYALMRNDVLGGVLVGVTVAMGVLPEEFPVVLTVFLAMGAWRISRAGVLTRSMPAIETIGAVTVLAVDKTGTLTENRMRLALLDTLDARFDLRHAAVTLDQAAHHLLHTALAASERKPFDPMERAIHAAAQHFIPDKVAVLAETTLAHEYDLTPELLAVTHVWRTADGYAVCVKGSPETILGLCRVPESQRTAFLQRIDSYTQEGLRVIGVASGSFDAAPLPASPDQFDLQLLGFVALADPLRHDVASAISECHHAGIRVVMITGDHPGTALAIAQQAGLDVAAGVMTGAELAALDDQALLVRAAQVNVYARFKPEHKLRLVQAFKTSGEIVAMTGDGVNDAPALKAAHVGVAMGGHGTDVAREAAALVLVNDNFAALVAAVRLGRRIYDNIRHAMSYIVAVHIPIAGLGLAPVLFDWPLLLFPVHVLFLEFVIDPACTLVFEADPESQTVMQRRPRPTHERLFSRAMLRTSLLLGGVVLAYSLTVYYVALISMTEQRARTLTFIAIVIANLGLIFVSRSQRDSLSGIYARPNKVYWRIAALTCAALALVTYVPGLAALFKFDAPAWQAVVSVTISALLLMLLTGKFTREVIR